MYAGIGLNNCHDDMCTRAMPPCIHNNFGHQILVISHTTYSVMGHWVPTKMQCLLCERAFYFYRLSSNADRIFLLLYIYRVIWQSAIEIAVFLYQENN